MRPLEIPEALNLYRKGMSIKKIADRLRVSSTGVYNYLRRNGIKFRPPVIGGRVIPEREVVRLYVEKKMTVWEIADGLGFCGTGIWKCLKRTGISLRVSGPKDRPWAIRNRGKEYQAPNGRWWVRGIRSSRTKNAKLRARVVVERKLGVILPRSIHVHHRNERVWDDKPKNLTPLPAGDHARHHHTGKKNPLKASMKGRRHSAETIRKISEKALIRWAEWKKDLLKSEEVLEAMSLGQQRRRG